MNRFKKPFSRTPREQLWLVVKKCNWSWEMRSLFKIFLTFSRIGALTFGGGYSMLPMFQRELVEKNKWLSEEELADYYSISQCLPGIIAVNTASLAGYKHKGRAGGIAASLGVIFPSIVIILIIAAFLSNFSDIPIVQHAFAGIRVCVSVLIINTVIKLWKHAVTDKASLVIFIIVFAASLFTGLPTVVLIVAAGAVGIGLMAIRGIAG
jgi:chromate transporter